MKTNPIAIDLGTSSSCVGVLLDEKVRIIANDRGNRTTPSCVAFTKTGRLLGDCAKDQMELNPTNTVFGAMRLIGQKFDSSVVQSDMKNWPFKVISTENGYTKVEVEYKGETKTVTPQEIVSMVLAKMKRTAEVFLEESVKDCVIAVPSPYNLTQIDAIRDSAAIAGLNVLRFINGSTAAGMAYGFDMKNRGERNTLIFDLGGGALCVSILQLEDGISDVRSTSGDSHLGGEDFDTRMVTHFVAEFKRKHKLDLSSDPVALFRLRIACEKAKRTLSLASDASIDIDSLFEGIDFHTTITRQRLEELCADLFRACLDPIEKCLRDARMETSGIHDIVLVGGSSRIPKVQELISNLFSGGKYLTTSLNPEQSVAYGAALWAACLH